MKKLVMALATAAAFVGVSANAAVLACGPSGSGLVENVVGAGVNPHYTLVGPGQGNIYFVFQGYVRINSRNVEYSRSTLHLKTYFYENSVTLGHHTDAKGGDYYDGMITSPQNGINPTNTFSENFAEVLGVPAGESSPSIQLRVYCAYQ